MTETQVEAVNAATLFINAFTEHEMAQAINVITSIDSEAQDLAIALINNEISSWNPQETEFILH